MKRIISLILVLLFVSAGMISCNNSTDEQIDFLTGNYNYDLSEYITLADYKGLEASATPYQADEDLYVQMQVQSTLTYYARNVEVNRAAKIGDTVYIDAIGTIDGHTFENSTTKNYALTLGSNAIGAEFENRIVGSSAGAHLSFDIYVPDTEAELPELAGKVVHYEVDVLTVCEKELPEYTDEFVRAYLGAQSIESYESSLITTLRANYKENFYKSVIPQIWSSIVENTTVIKYPDKELREKYDNLVAGVQNYADIYGMTMEAFVKGTFDMTLDEFYEYAQTEAEASVKEEMICYAIARAENLTLSESEYIARASSIAVNSYNLTNYKELEAKYDIGMIYKAILIDMAQEKVADSANITYTDSEEQLYENYVTEN